MRRLLLLLIAPLALAACPSHEEGVGLDPIRFTDVECAPTGTTRCLEGMFQTCEEGYWYNRELCGSVCSLDLGCVACEPLMGRACDGDNVVGCNSDGSLGAIQQTCGLGGCVLGQCEDDCGEGTDLIYVVDRDDRFLSFDPREDAFTFTELGTLGCPAGPQLAGWGGGVGEGTPFSMSLDREGVAWVLYTSGEIFHVPVNNIDNCQPSPWVGGSEGFELFGMGFVLNEIGSDAETLYIAGGTATAMSQHLTGRLGAIDPETAQVSPVGSLTPTELGPELTGTGAAESFAYFPGVASSMIARLDKFTGLNAQEWAIEPLDGALRAWAFAHWGDRFYIFVTWQDPDDGSQISQVHRFDRITADVEIIIPSHNYRIVGAGVSTCAPFVFQ